MTAISYDNLHRHEILVRTTSTLLQKMFLENNLENKIFGALAGARARFDDMQAHHLSKQSVYMHVPFTRVSAMLVTCAVQLLVQ